jgi:hypothetical protein
VTPKNSISWPWSWCLTNFNKIQPWLYLLIGVYKNFDISHEYFWWQDLSIGTNRFGCVTLTSVSDLLIENLNFGYLICMVDTTALTFHVTIPCGKTFPWVPTDLILWHWPLCLTSLLKTLTMSVSFEWYALWLWYFTCFLWQNLSLGFHRFDLVTLASLIVLFTENFNLG